MIMHAVHSSSRTRPSSLLVCGCSSGIGEHLFNFYKAENFFEVWGCSRSVMSDPCHIKCDCSNEKEVVKLMRYCNPDIVINCVGQAAMNLAILSSVEQYHKVISNNLLSTFLICREAGKRMQARGFGRIVNFGSCTCAMHIPGESLYTASKSGILAFSRVLAKELSPHVTVNCISPGPVVTRLLSHVPTQKIADVLHQQIIKRLASFEEIQYVVDWLISENSGMITGQNIYLNGAG